MKIAYISADSGIPIRGQKGSSVHVRSISGALRDLGHEVRGFSPALDEDEEAGFTAVRTGGFLGDTLDLIQEELQNNDEMKEGRRLLREWRRIAYNEHMQRTLLPLLQDWRPDFIYERYTLFGYQGIELARSLGVPLLLEVNSPLWQEASTYRNLALKATAEEIERRVLTSADAVFVVSSALAEYTSEIGVRPERTYVSANGIDPRLFDPSIPGAETRAAYDLTDKWVVGFVGSLRPWQDLDTLAEAVSLVRESVPNAQLMVVGDGQGPERLTAHGDDFVTLTGAVDHERVPVLMSAMDAVVVPYPLGEHNYFSPMKLFEAMAMAKPVAGARVGQVQQVLTDGVDGLLYQPGDARDLADKLHQIATMPDRGSALGKAALDLVAAHHTWKANAEKIVAVAQSLIEERVWQT